MALNRTDSALEPAKALVLGSIGLLRSLGRKGIPVTLVQERGDIMERASRYCREFLRIPSLHTHAEEAAQALLEYGAAQTTKPVVFLGGELGVMLFSRHRERLGAYFRVIMAGDELIGQLVDKARFASLAEHHGLAVPKTRIPHSRDECLAAAAEIGFPCIMKPVTQDHWCIPEIREAIGLHKAIRVASRDELCDLLDKLPPLAGKEMIQEYIPGDDAQHFDIHAYFDRQGRPRGHVVVHKLRTYPIHFGMGCYAECVEEPEVAALCMETLQRIGYVGAADVDVKRHAQTGRNYILEINPRFSLLSVIDQKCGINLPWLHYCEAVGLDMPTLPTRPTPCRWISFGADLKALRDYRKARELTRLGWLRSLFAGQGRIEFHAFAWDDPMPLLAVWWLRVRHQARRAVRFLGRVFGWTMS